MTVQLIATASFPYAGRSLKPGDLFQAVSERDAETLRLLDKAEDAPLAYATRDIQPESPAPTTKIDRRTKAYRHRMMVAEK